MRTLLGLAIIVWFGIGLAAAAQRGYFGNDIAVNCKSLGDTVLTIVAGPLNYAGMNPKITCDLPNPST